MNRKNLSPLVLLLLTISLLTTSCSKESTPEKPYVLVSATGDINAQLNVFRALAGDKINTTPGATGGRREINWDGLPDHLLNKKLPEDFFNPTEPGSPVQNQRGLVYTTAGECRVSNDNFTAVNPEAAGQFTPFSGNKVFSNISTRLWDVEFQLAGQVHVAKVSSFGIVFSDVDIANSTFMEFFEDNKSLGKFFVPPHDNNSGFSFLGVHFNSDKITRVRVGHEGALADGHKDVSSGGPEDLVVLDDFIYSEPVRAK